MHPVALRVTPGPGEVEEASSVAEIRPIQRPQPKKHTGNFTFVLQFKKRSNLLIEVKTFRLVMHSFFL